MNCALAVDPALRIALRGALALLFASAAAHKLRDLTGFRAVVANYELLPRRWVDVSSFVLIVAELSIAIGLLHPAHGSHTALAAAGLLVLYAAAISVNIARGRRDIDCGCAGVARRQPLGIGLIVRNGVLVAAALAGALPATPRGLSWVDGITVMASVVTLGLLYAAVETLVANAPGITALMRPRSVGLAVDAMLRNPQSRVTGHA